MGGIARRLDRHGLGVKARRQRAFGHHRIQRGKHDRAHISKEVHDLIASFVAPPLPERRRVVNSARISAPRAALGKRVAPRSD